MSVHSIRLGTHAEKDYLIRGSRWLDEVIVNANLVEAGAGATAAFLLSIRQKPYMIDPITYSFGQDPSYLMNTSRDEPKRTFHSLSDKYGELCRDSLARRQALTPSDFQARSVVEDFSQHVLEYQRTVIMNALEANEVFLEPGIEELPPVRLVAPYFFNDPSQNWLDVNHELAEVSCALAPGDLPVWAVVSFDGRALDRREDLESLVEAYRSTECAGFLFWPSGFDDIRATPGQIVGYRWLVRELCADRPGRAMYGGYLSALLKDEGLDGLSHGVGYGARKGVTPVVGGGMPPARFYLRAIHDNISISEMIRLARGLNESQFRQTICDCTICSGLIESGGVDLLRAEFGAAEDRRYGHQIRSVPIPRVYRLTRFHYIENRHMELTDVAQKTRADLLRDLESGYDMYAAGLGSSRLDYLHWWRHGLQEPLG